jgi:hypothetical protein
MDNKAKYLYVAIAVLLVSNGYLLYRLGNAEPVVDKKKDVFVTGSRDGLQISVRFKDVSSFSWDDMPMYLLNTAGGDLLAVTDEDEIEKIDKYLGKKKDE